MLTVLNAEWLEKQGLLVIVDRSECVDPIVVGDVLIDSCNNVFELSAVGHVRYKNEEPASAHQHEALVALKPMEPSVSRAMPIGTLRKRPARLLKA